LGGGKGGVERASLRALSIASSRLAAAIGARSIGLAKEVLRPLLRPAPVRTLEE
jgi:hypothetical protein